MAYKYPKSPASKTWLMSEARQAVLMHAREQANLRRSLRAILESQPRDYQRQRIGYRHAVAPVPPAPDERKSRPTPVD
jgi:hypothetical protein